MAEYPDDIYTPREIENMPNVVYDADKKTVLFSEDINGSNDEIVAIETLLGEFDPSWPVPVVGLFETVVKYVLSQERESLAPSIGSGTLAPESVGLALTDPLGLERDNIIVAVGGSFTVTKPPGPIQSYMMLITVVKTSATAYNFHIKYFDTINNVFVSPLPIPFGAVIGGDPTIKYDVRWLG